MSAGVGVEHAAASPAGTAAVDFVPRRGLRNGHLQTIVGNYIRRDTALPPADDLILEVEPAAGGPAAAYGPTRILCRCHFQPPEVRRDRLTLVLVHGLEGSSQSRYILSNATRAWAAGANVVRMNMRSCGGTDSLSPTIYHSGRSGDVGVVVDALRSAHGLERIVLVGYSMGGNLVFKYAGEQARQNRTPDATPNGWSDAAAPPLTAVIGVSPLMDLAVSSAALHELKNRVYEWNFLRGMLRRVRRKAEIFPAIYAALEREGVLRQIRSLRDFDHRIVARYGGFADADDYYASVASSHYAADFHVPTLVIHSLDDPFVKMLPATREALRANPHVTFRETAYGGHCAFLAAPDAAGDGFWAERTLHGWLRDRFPVA